jgi:preprotein translocase subunit YajC
MTATIKKEAQDVQVGETVFTAAGNWAEVTAITCTAGGLVVMSLKDHCPCHWHKTETVQAR